MKITCNFDSGNIEVIQADSVDNIQLAIRKDHNSVLLSVGSISVCIRQVLNPIPSELPTLVPLLILVAGKIIRLLLLTTVKPGFGYPQNMDGKELTIHHYPEAESVYFAYFAPYSYERHMDLL